MKRSEFDHAIRAAGAMLEATKNLDIGSRPCTHGDAGTGEPAVRRTNRRGRRHRRGTCHQEPGVDA